MHDMIGSAGMLRGWVEVWSAHMLLLLTTLAVSVGVAVLVELSPHICERHGRQLRSIRSCLRSKSAFSVGLSHACLPSRPYDDLRAASTVNTTQGRRRKPPWKALPVSWRH